MNIWLLKTEPSTYGFDDLVRDQTTRWDGIANPVAIKYLKTAAVHDLAIIYHTGNEKAAVGVAEIVRAAYPDPKNDKLQMVDLKVGARFAKPVTLAQLKAEPVFADSPLSRQGRLSFVPITAAQWKRIETLSR